MEGPLYGRGCCGEPRLRCDIWSDREVAQTEENKGSDHPAVHGSYRAAPAE